ncbi:MAG: FMN phosphatase YigB (HAD superfamily) [Acidimicrobiales bacterium]|jgi:FMN phosphatase YigB (HAD superfamily)
MKYILDFDEVLFNTTALKEKMGELKISETERGLEVFDRIKELDPEFDFASLVFPGALKFLNEYGKDCIIVSSATSETTENNTDLEKQLAFQMEKIVRSGVKDLAGIVRVVGVSKSEALHEIQERQESKGEDIVFVDDRERYVREAHELGIKSIWMDRAGKGYLTNTEGVPVMLEFPRVGSFAEFVELVKLNETNT